jgi:DNA-binding response OmpR family regulator
MYVVALVDPRADSSAELSGALTGYGCRVSCFQHWREARASLCSVRVDAVVLTDWHRLGGRGGHRYLRGPTRNAPFVLVTDAADPLSDERFASILTYPLSADALFAAVQAACEERHLALQLGEWRLDVKRRTLAHADRCVDLTPVETELLRVLMSAEEEFVNSSDLVAQAWGISTLLDRRVLYTHVAWLRRKLQDELGVADPIVSVRQRGYRFDATAT